MAEEWRCFLEGFVGDGCIEEGKGDGESLEEFGVCLVEFGVCGGINGDRGGKR